MISRQSIQAIEAEIVDEFSLFDDWMDRYAYLIDLGKNLDDLPYEYKTEPFRVKGCQSNVWLRSWREGDRVFFAADSDAMITRGLVALLVRVLSGQPAGEIIDAPLAFVDAIGLRQHLSTNRSNGLNAMIKRMKNMASVAIQPADESL